MPNPKKTYFNWSSGKDASLALYHLKQNKTLQIDQLITTVNTHYNRVSMHGLRRELLEQQAKSMGLQLTTVELPKAPTMDTYNKMMTNTITALKKEGYTDCGFGDIFLEDLRYYREQQLQPHHIQCHFPLWKKDTKAIISEFIALGFKAVVICTKADVLDASFVGRELDETFINDLPKGVDPCGENGEFHTFCYDGPLFKTPIPFTLGEKTYRAYKNPKQDDTETRTSDLGFWFCDLIPQDQNL